METGEYFLISIHALLAESDAVDVTQRLPVVGISIHALLAESDLFPLPPDTTTGISIHALLAESDVANPKVYNGVMNFYPRSPCGERPPAGAFLFSSGYFYPRSPCGERLVGLILIDCAQDISIHALLAESDSPKAMIWRFSSHFYPRSPCGERRLFSFFCWRTPEFLSTLSLRRATHAALASHLHDGFLSTLSLRRATGWHLGIPDDTF